MFLLEKNRFRSPFTKIVRFIIIGIAYIIEIMEEFVVTKFV